MIPGYPSPVKCHKLSGHGIQTIEDAIANSCNVALMQMAETIGVEDFVKYQSIFGLERQPESIFREKQRDFFFRRRYETD